MERIGLSGVAGVLPVSHRDITELAAAGLVASPPEALSALGFERVHIAEPDQPPEQMALAAARAALHDAGVAPHEIDAVIWASARVDNHLCHTDRDAPFHVMSGFRYA